MVLGSQRSVWLFNLSKEDKVSDEWNIICDFSWLKKSDHHFLHVAVQGIDGSITLFKCGIDGSITFEFEFDVDYLRTTWSLSFLFHIPGIHVKTLSSRCNQISNSLSFVRHVYRKHCGWSIQHKWQRNMSTNIENSEQQSLVQPIDQWLSRWVEDAYSSDVWFNSHSCVNYVFCYSHEMFLWLLQLLCTIEPLRLSHFNW